MLSVEIEIWMFQSTFHSNLSIFVYEREQYGHVHGFWEFFAFCYWLRRLREALVLNKSEQNSSCLVDFFCFERSFLLRFESYVLGIDVSIQLKVLYCLQLNSWSSLVSVFYIKLAHLQLRSPGTIALANFPHLSETMPAHLTTPTPWDFRLTFLWWQCLVVSQCLWYVSIGPWRSFPIFLLICWQQTLVFPVSWLQPI